MLDPHNRETLAGKCLYSFFQKRSKAGSLWSHPLMRSTNIISKACLHALISVVIGITAFAQTNGLGDAWKSDKKTGSQPAATGSDSKQSKVEATKASPSQAEQKVDQNPSSSSEATSAVAIPETVPVEPKVPGTASSAVRTAISAAFSSASGASNVTNTVVDSADAAANAVNVGMNASRLEMPASAPDDELSGIGPVHTFQATAYSLPGKTRSGAPVRRGVLAADPRVLPLGTVVQLKAGNYSGVYTVHDTGGAIKGNLVDVWMPSSKEARIFGRRSVKLTVLKYGGTAGRVGSKSAPAAKAKAASRKSRR